MKIFLALYTTFLFAGCAFNPVPQKNSRRVHPAISDLDNLEMLLLNDQQPLVEQERTPSQQSSIRLGMEKNGVRRFLGAPNQVEVAGNPKYENERWIYETQVPTLGGYYKEKRVIYFENGAVVGWESH